jgi:Alpha/beta hydrolase domain
MRVSLSPARVIVAVVVGSAIVLAPVSAGFAEMGAGKDAVPSPKVTGPVPGQPASLSAVDLTAHGYVEEEFFIEGTARSYEPTATLAPDGRWSVKESTTAPYRTRVLVRRPKSPSEFKGVVQVEWLNVSGGLDAAPDWGLGNAELLRGGFVWVGVSAQSTGVRNLKDSRSDRYATLEHPGDAYSYDIYSQAAQALRRPTDTNLLGGRNYRVQRLIADGESQSAFRMVTYINAVQPLTRMFDGFFVHSRFAVGAPITEGGADAIPNPTLIRTDGNAQILVLEAETDVPRYLPARQPDGARFRLWEIAGTAHFDEDGLHALTGIPKESMAQTPPLGCAQRINSAPQRYVVAAAMHHMARWASGGRPPPRAPRIDVSGEPPTIQRDQFGNARGGIRLPQLEVPTATLSGEPGGGPGFCSLFGFTAAFDAGQLASLYPTQKEYVTKFDKATDRAVRQGFILAADAKEAKEAVSRASVGA